MIIQYDSIGALRADYIKHRPANHRPDGNTSWFNGETETDSLALTASGDTRLVPEAERLIASLECNIDTPKRQWERSPAGAFASVPDVLAGLPTPMRRQVHIHDEGAPITILVTTTSSAGISAEMLQRRGIVILALVMALSRNRPVTLQQLCCVDGQDNGETVILAEINTRPLDLATACYVLTSAGFARRLTYGLAKWHNNFIGSWPRDFNFSAPQPYYAKLLPRLGLAPEHTLVIEAARLGDALLDNPLAWINAQITRFTHLETEED